MQKNSGLFGILFVLLLQGAVVAAASWQWIDGSRVQGKVKEGSGLRLIDVRSSAAYEAAHIEGSVNIPADVLAHKKFPAKKALILIDDSLGQRSARQAAESLVKQGQEQVSVLEGGIPAWKSESLPLVENKAVVRGVTADELKWALMQSVSIKLYDLRNSKDREQEQLQNSESIAGKTVVDRVDKLKNILSVGENKKDLASRMKKPLTVVLVFSAVDDAEGYTRNILQGVKADVRYLIGGYEATISDKLRSQQIIGACPTCPGGKLH